MTVVLTVHDCRSLPEGFQITAIERQEQGLLIHVLSTFPTGTYPLCGEVSDAIHSHYQRRLKDLPCAGTPVSLILSIRKFFCRNQHCSRKIFTERMLAFAKPYDRIGTSKGRGRRTSCGANGEVSSILMLPTSSEVGRKDIKKVPPCQEELVLSDFGLAALAHGSGSLSSKEAIGTLAYMAPEQIEGHPRAASDQYALGCVVYEWLGSRPCEDSPTEVMVRKGTHNYQPSPIAGETVNIWQW